MKQNLTFAEQYEANKPLRIAAFKKYYKTVKKYETITDAQNKAAKGQWILKVQPLTNETPFYTLHTFDANISKWMATGVIIGMWNELTVIGKTKNNN